MPSFKSIIFFSIFNMESQYWSFIFLAIFLLIIFFLPIYNKHELFTLGTWKNNLTDPSTLGGFCGPDFSKFSPKDNVAVRCVGDGKMTYADCCKLQEVGQVCAVNLDNWEAYQCKYYPGKACERCTTQNAQY